MKNSDFKKRLIQCLERSKESHGSSSLSNLSREFDLLDCDRWDQEDVDLMLAWNFWEGWLDEANHHFSGYYGDIEKSDWPFLATVIIDALTSGKSIQEPKILKQFDYRKI